jgi:hypothetical protein
MHLQQSRQQAAATSAEPVGGSAAGPHEEFDERARERHGLRRERFIEQLGDGVAILPAGTVRLRSRSTEYRFRQDADFFYLTGYDEPDAVAADVGAWLDVLAATVTSHSAAVPVPTPGVKPLLDEAWERLMEMNVRNAHFRHGDGTRGCEQDQQRTATLTRVHEAAPNNEGGDSATPQNWHIRSTGGPCAPHHRQRTTGEARRESASIWWTSVGYATASIQSAPPQ